VRKGPPNRVDMPSRGGTGLLGRAAGMTSGGTGLDRPPWLIVPAPASVPAPPSESASVIHHQEHIRGGGGGAAASDSRQYLALNLDHHANQRYFKFTILFTPQQETSLVRDRRVPTRVKCPTDAVECVPRTIRRAAVSADAHIPMGRVSVPLTHKVLFNHDGPCHCVDHDVEPSCSKFKFTLGATA
jgi:hypothetical protein